ncbi:histone-like nucleoid-structuring protein, MvaT/MvaU family [Pseudomonas sp. p106]|uniref:histone-like nucleoid-structuring protein, MvaT/MvaU family n=1 Tax=Pseudomonas sp. p106 TaxID=2479854 RepID=UPI000F7A6957|nr:histone-like nucleoid-structuring protein, MvaT/MvaU family [Pseudomonas sp. p106]RRV39250.1 transcriptional regulator [Pseudomonas sp. p106]
MSRLAEYRKLEQTLAAQLAELETMKNDASLKKEIEFEKKLRSLLESYGFSLRHVVEILDPQAASRRGPATASAAKPSRKARAVKVYKNPHNGELIETKGGNHKLLKEWKQEYGADEVESWIAK